MKLKLRKYLSLSIIIIINIIITIIVPIMTYLNFKNIIKSFNCSDCPQSVVNQVYMGGMEPLYDILIYVFVFVGFIVTVCTYFISRFQKYSLQRSILMFSISIAYLINILFSSQMSIILVKVTNVQIVVNFSGIFTLLIIISLLYISKALFDLIDFKVNKSQYASILRREKSIQIKQKKLNERLRKK